MRHVSAVKADFRGVEMVGTNLTNADLREARFEPLISPQGRKISSTLVKANLRYANLTGAQLREVDLSHADLSYSVLLGADLTDSRFSGAKFTGARMDDEQKALIAKATR